MLLIKKSWSCHKELFWGWNVILLSCRGFPNLFEMLNIHQMAFMVLIIKWKVANGKEIASHTVFVPDIYFQSCESVYFYADMMRITSPPASVEDRPSEPWTAPKRARFISHWSIGKAVSEQRSVTQATPHRGLLCIYTRKWDSMVF